MPQTLSSRQLVESGTEKPATLTLVRLNQADFINLALSPCQHALSQCNDALRRSRHHASPSFAVHGYLDFQCENRLPRFPFSLYTDTQIPSELRFLPQIQTDAPSNFLPGTRQPLRQINRETIATGYNLCDLYGRGGSVRQPKGARFLAAQRHLAQIQLGFRGNQR